ncbi:MAG: phosphate signaling complex protein PhoU [Planctomycetes bacterium]|nr:phosphate signaling complex protein PhoU [Planctomycetota bacterium]
MTKHFMRDLSRLADQLLRISSNCEFAFAEAINAILARDAVRGRRVVEGDREIDRMEVQLEEEALKILALHAPVAGDLRFVIATIKINNDLERIADIAANIGKRAIDLQALPPISAPENFQLMAQKAQTMLRIAIQSLLKRDVDQARELLAMDDEVDDLMLEILNNTEVRIKQEPQAVSSLLRWSNVARLVERIADYATNIAEDIIYMEEGDIVRHGC